ncbi:hypothetical protein FB451DRAFT_1401634 [Mycena latifolia]|nr:hypothetical protein FB451DRAFT_1401634 [Mycena latifolia]
MTQTAEEGELQELKRRFGESAMAVLVKEGDAAVASLPSSRRGRVCRLGAHRPRALEAPTLEATCTRALLAGGGGLRVELKERRSAREESGWEVERTTTASCAVGGDTFAGEVPSSPRSPPAPPPAFSSTPSMRAPRQRQRGRECARNAVLRASRTSRARVPSVPASSRVDARAPPIFPSSYAWRAKCGVHYFDSVGGPYSSFHSSAACVRPPRVGERARIPISLPAPRIPRDIEGARAWASRAASTDPDSTRERVFNSPGPRVTEDKLVQMLVRAVGVQTEDVRLPPVSEGARRRMRRHDVNARQGWRRVVCVPRRHSSTSSTSSASRAQPRPLHDPKKTALPLHVRLAGGRVSFFGAGVYLAQPRSPLTRPRTVPAARPLPLPGEGARLMQRQFPHPRLRLRRSLRTRVAAYFALPQYESHTPASNVLVWGSLSAAGAEPVQEEEEWADGRTGIPTAARSSAVMSGSSAPPSLLIVKVKVPQGEEGGGMAVRQASRH